jgi:hypothetical protein
MLEIDDTMVAGWLMEIYCRKFFAENGLWTNHYCKLIAGK